MAVQPLPEQEGWSQVPVRGLDGKEARAIGNQMGNRSEISGSGPCPESFRVPDEAVLAPHLAASAVETLGYVNSELFTAIRQSSRAVVDSGELLDLPAHVTRATRAIPPRPYTDILVQNFFDVVNHHYAILHQPSFMEAYAGWWSQRRETQKIPTIHLLSLTCLVLRICANSVQFLQSPALPQIESDLGASSDTLGTDYQSAAQAISDYLPPGAGGLVQCQQLFLGATWFKAEADFVRSWHALAAAVRQAQEIGIHDDGKFSETNHFEKEMRRRIWCSLYTWDRFMAATFNRPLIIEFQSSVPLPSPSLDQLDKNDEVPTSVVAQILENQLARQLSDSTGGTVAMTSKLSFVESWMSSLPPVFAVENPDRCWDADYPRLRFQRLQLHLVGYMTQLALLRPLLASRTLTDFEHEIQSNDSPQFISVAIDISLKAMSASKEFFDLCFPQQAKYFMVSFCPFEIAALLISLLLRTDIGSVISRRQEVVAAIGQALHIARCLRPHTRMGDTTWNILAALKHRLRLQAGENEILEKAEKSGKINNDDHQVQQMNAPPVNQSLGYAVFNRPQPILATGWCLPDQSLSTANELAGIDLGLLEGLWDWQSLHLDQLDSNLVGEENS